MRPMLVLSLSALALAAAAPCVHAEPAFAAGQTVVSASIGAGVHGLYGSADMPLVALSAERGVSDVLSIGGSLGFASSTYQYYADYSWTLGYSIVAARASYHLGEFVEMDNLDAYVGGSLGYNRVSVKAQAGNESSSVGLGSYVLYGAHLGARYFFQPKLAGFAELGYGLGNASIGLSMRF
jgi:hypothetical protein